MNALVSVIVPTYKRASVVTRAIDSVIAQVYRPIELIVVNDGSPDHTAEVLAGVEPRVRKAGLIPKFINKANGGAASARNTGLRAIAGDYFAFLDDDDIWMPEKLARQLAAIEKTGASASCCFVARSGGRSSRAPNDEGSLLRGRDGPRFVAREAYAHITSLVARSALLPRVGEFDESLRVYEDEEWKARLAYEADFCAVGEELAAYTFSEDSLTRFAGEEESRRRDADFVRHLELIRERCADKPGWSEEAWRKRAAHVYDECAKHLLYAGDIAGAKRLYELGMKSCGPILALPKLKTKLRKAWWLSLIGLRPRHPKLKRGEAIKG
jgi:glycosyltransferase involved in cell wall biosynthesis